MTTNNASVSSPASLITMCVAIFGLVILFGGILQQIGAPIIYISLLLMAFVIGLYLFAGMLTKTMRFSTFQLADKNSRPFFNAMASASGVLSGGAFIVYAGFVYSHGTDFLALFLGILLGIGFLTLFFSATLARSGAATLASLLFPARSSRWYATCVILIVTASCFLLLHAQIKLLSLFIENFYGIDPVWGAVMIVAVSLLSLTMGGMQALSLTRLLAYPVIALALIVPIVWASYTIAGNPLPQFSFGEGAVATIAELDKEMLAADLISAEQVFDPVRDGKLLSGFNFFAALLTIAMGIAAMPHLLQHFTTFRKGRQARKSGVWTFVLAAILLSLLPAVAAFAKLDIYTALLGIRIADMESEVAWIFALSGGAELPLVHVCGALVSGAQEVMQACGKSENYFLSIGDIAINPDYLMLSFGHLSNLPELVTVAIVTGALLAVFTTVDGLLLATANTFTTDFYHRIVKPKSPPGVRLFMNRFFLVFFAGLLLIAIPYIDLSADKLFTAAIVLTAASLFPALLSRIWMPGLSDMQIGISMLFAFFATLAGLVLTAYGADLVQNSGDEIVIRIPGIVEQLHPLGYGVLGVPAFFLAALISGGVERLVRVLRERRQQRATA